MEYKEKKLYINRFDNLEKIPEDINEIHYDAIILWDDDIKIINKLIKLFQSKKKKIKVVLPLEYQIKPVGKEKLNLFIDKESVVFETKTGSSNITVQKMIEAEDILDLFVKDIKESKLSPYEKFIAVYYLVKNFKSYKYFLDSKKRDRAEPSESRVTYLTILNDWMVCVGFTSLLETLLNRVGINTKEIGFSQIINPNKAGHSKCLVDIVDPKYDIDGLFVADPTADNTSEKSADNFFDLALSMNVNVYESIFYTKIFSQLSSDDLELLVQITSFSNKEEMLDYYVSKREELLLFLEKINPKLYEEIKSVSIKEQANKTNNYFSKKLIQSHIPINKQYKALLNVKEHIDEKKYPEQEIRYSSFINSCEESLRKAIEKIVIKSTNKKNSRNR